MASKRKGGVKSAFSTSTETTNSCLLEDTQGRKKRKTASKEIPKGFSSPAAPAVTIETVVETVVPGDDVVASTMDAKVSKFAWKNLGNDDTNHEYACCADFIFCAMGGKDLGESINSIGYMLKPTGLALLEVVPSVTQEICRLPEHLKEVKLLQVPLESGWQIPPTSLSRQCVASFVLLSPASSRVTFGDHFSWPTGTKTLASGTTDGTLLSEAAVRGMLQEMFHERRPVMNTLVCASKDVDGTVARVCSALGLPCLVFSTTPKVSPDTSWVTGGFLLGAIQHILASFTVAFPEVGVSIAADPDWYFADGVQKYNEVYDSSHSAQVIPVPSLIIFQKGRSAMHSSSKSVGDTAVRFVILPFQPEKKPHWAVIIVDIVEGSFFFIDSMFKHFKQDFACRAHMYCGIFTRNLPPVPDLRFFSEQTSPQKNSYDCGIFVMSSVLMFLRSKVKLPSSCPMQQDMAAARMYFMNLGSFTREGSPAEMFQQIIPSAIAPSAGAVKFNFAVVAVGNISTANQ